MKEAFSFEITQFIISTILFAAFFCVVMRRLFRFVTEFSIRFFLISISLFIWFFLGVLDLCIITYTDCYTSAVESLYEEKKIQGEVGMMQSHHLDFLVGVLKYTPPGDNTAENRERGYARLAIVVKGSKANCLVKVDMIQENTRWYLKEYEIWGK
ncbi:MAG: hypothetical protein R3B47_16520 [Bacteroidia bacterium]